MIDRSTSVFTISLACHLSNWWNSPMARPAASFNATLWELIGKVLYAFESLLAFKN